MINLCSYCHNPRHNIKTCNDNNMLLFHQFILQEKITKSIIFLEILELQPLHKLWGFAVKYCNILARNKNKQDCINAIYNKYLLYTLPMLEHELNEINLTINTIPIPIPLSFEIDTNTNTNTNNNEIDDFELLSVSSYHSSIDDNEITWSIDRTGDYTNINSNINSNTNIKKIQDFPITYLTNEKGTELEKECNICYENQNIKNYIKLQCNHQFCYKCIENQLKNNKITCAFCRQPFIYY